MEDTMPDKDKVESLLKLADASWRDYNERRSIEWKVNFGLWAALGAFGGFVFQRDTPPPQWVALIASALLAVAFLIYTTLWKAEIQKRNRLDLNNARYYWTEVDTELGTKPPEVRRIDRQWQTMATDASISSADHVLVCALGSASAVGAAVA
jgi:hypothetical protein